MTKDDVRFLILMMALAFAIMMVACTKKTTKVDDFGMCMIPHTDVKPPEEMM